MRVNDFTSTSMKRKASPPLTLWDAAHVMGHANMWTWWKDCVARKRNLSGQNAHDLETVKCGLNRARNILQKTLMLFNSSLYIAYKCVTSECQIFLYPIIFYLVFMNEIFVSVFVIIYDVKITSF